MESGCSNLFLKIIQIISIIWKRFTSHSIDAYPSANHALITGSSANDADKKQETPAYLYRSCYPLVTHTPLCTTDESMGSE